MLYIIGASVNCIAIMMVIFNAIYDMLRLKSTDYSHNDTINLAGAGLAVLVVVSYFLKIEGKTAIANMLVWVPALPLLLAGFFILMMVVLRPDWK
jgi:hypothetical protein